MNIFGSVVVLIITLVIFSGCTTVARDPIIGTWEWSDGKGYSERYTFNEDHTFSANALGSDFSGTWQTTSTGHYQVTYYYVNGSKYNETLIELVLYDEKTDAVYFPAHLRVSDLNL